MSPPDCSVLQPALFCRFRWRWTKKRRAATIIIRGVLLAAFLAVFLLPGLPGMLGEAHALLHGRAEDDFGSGRIYIWKTSGRQ